MALEIIVLDGDGIGPEVVDAAVLAGAAAVARTGSAVDFVRRPVGLEALEAHGRTVPHETHQAVAKAGAALLGPVSTHLYDIFDPASANPSAYFRRTFDLYANVRPARSRAGIPAPVPDMDVVVVRENTEGFYADRNLMDGNGELRPDEDTVLSVRVVTRKACLRIARFGFQLARLRGGKRRVSLIHKANVLRRGDGLFLECCRESAKDYPDVIVDDFHVDAAAMHLITHPQHFDVIITTNMFGDILSDETAGLVGGLGVAPGLNVGESLAIAQAVHGSAPDIAGLGIANPIAEILSCAMLLDWLATRHGDPKLYHAAWLMESAVDEVLRTGERLTPDIGGGGGTADVARAIAGCIQRMEL